MLKFQFLKITHNTKNKEDPKLNEKKTLDANTEMTKMSELFDKNFKATITKMPQWTIMNNLKQMKKQKVLAKV